MTNTASLNPDQNLSLARLGYRSFDNAKATGRCDLDCFVCCCHFILSRANVRSNVEMPSKQQLLKNEENSTSTRLYTEQRKWPLSTQFANDHFWARARNQLECCFYPKSERPLLPRCIFWPCLHVIKYCV